MKKFLIQAIALVAVLIIALFLFRSEKTVSLPFVPEKEIVKKIEINNAIITAEIADTPEKRKKGLSGKESIASDGGMLFVFENTGKYPFWMKGLSFPLDFIWIRDGRVVEVMENIAPPLASQKDESLLIYQSKDDVDKVLEVNGGVAGRLNIKPGDKVLITE